jgi:hypothetical protein
VELVLAAAIVGAIWWWAGRGRAASGPDTARPVSPAPAVRSEPPTVTETEARRREDGAFVEGMVIAHHVWPRPVEPADHGLDRAEVEGLAWALGDDPDAVELALDEGWTAEELQDLADVGGTTTDLDLATDDPWGDGDLEGELEDDDGW